MVGIGFFWVLLIIGSIREGLGSGTLFSDMQILLGPIGEDLERAASDPLHPTCDHSEYLKTEAQRGLRSPKPRLFEHLRSGVLDSILEPDGPSLKMLGRIFSSDDWLKWHAR